jgi:DNA-binding MarR family transcriptional regulator
MSEEAGSYEDFFKAQNELEALFARTLEGMLKAEGITVPQAFALKTLKEQGAACKMSDLAAMRLQSPASMTGIVNRLIHLGLVRRMSDAHDRRVILLALTSKGEATLSRAELKVQTMMRPFFEGIPAADRAVVMRMFEKLKEYLKEYLQEELISHKRD